MRSWQLVICAVAVIVLAAMGLCCAQEVVTYPVSGKVLMPDGTPAVGALVEAWKIDNWANWTMKGTATAGEDGTFTMQVVRGRYRTYAVSGEYVYSDASKLIEASEAGLPDPVEMRLEKGYKVEGSVVDITNGLPVSGIRIISRDGEYAESSDSGEWSMVVRKRNQTITAMKEDYWWPIVNFAVSGDAAKVKVEIRPGGTIMGRVVDEQGQPIANVYIRTATPGYFYEHSIRTDADGQFVLGGQDLDAKAQVSAWAEGYESSRNQPVVFPADQREAEVELKLTKPKVRTITGRVTRQDGAPVEGVQVAYGHGTNFWDYVTARTDKDGKYTLNNARVEKCLVVASCGGLSPVYKQVVADKDIEMDFQMKSGHAVEGRVEDEDGNPLAGTWVTVAMEVKNVEITDNMYGSVGSTTTDKDGRFMLDSLPEGVVYADIYLEDHESITNERLKVDRKDYTLVLRKTVKGQICGTVVKESDGEPVTEFNVCLNFSQRISSSGLSFGLSEQGVNFQDTDGKFIIKGLTVNEGFRVVVTAPGYMQGSADPVMVKPEGEEAYKDTVIYLRPASPFEGSVMEAGTGSPIEGVLVTVWDTGGIGSSNRFDWDMSNTSLKSVSTRTDASGKFRFEAMPFSSGAIMLEKPGLARTLLKTAGFSRSLQVSMENGATVIGSVADEQGNVPPGVYLDIRHIDLNLSFRNTQINPDGSFKLEDVPTGEYMVTLRKEGRSTKYQAFELKAGETYQVDWDKQGSVIVEGKVLQNGKPVTNAKINVNVRKSGMNWAGSAETDADGSYKLSLFKPGEYSFSCMVGEWNDPNSFRIYKNEQLAEGLNQVDFSLPYGSISGKLVDKLTGKPIADASIRLYIRETWEQYTGRKSIYSMDAEPWWRSKNECKTDKNGAFQVKNLKAGEWLISVTSTRIPAAVVKLAEGEVKTGVVTKVPPTGSAKISIVGMKSLPEHSRIDCVDEYGLVHSPEYDGKTFSLEFLDLPVGKCRAVVESRDYLSTQVLFQVKANETTNVPVKLTKGPKIVFKPKGDLADPNGPVSVAYKITTPDGKPVMQRAHGLQWGGVIEGGGTFGPASIVVKPGTYLLKAAIRTNGDSWGDESDLTSYSGIIKVVSGKDTIVEIPWEQ